MNTISFKKNWEAMADPSIVKEICDSLRQIRLNKNLSQEQLAKQSGVNRITISRMEAGRAVTLLTLVQILRALNRLDILNSFNSEPQMSPMQILKLQEKQRQKASPVYKNKKNRTA